MQAQSIQHLPWQINPRKYCSEPEKMRAGEKRDSRTERTVMFIIVPDHGVSLENWLTMLLGLQPCPSHVVLP